MTSKRLHAIGIVLLAFGLVASVFNLVACVTQRQKTAALASRLDVLSIRVDDSLALPEKDRNKDALVASIEDARGELTWIKHSYESLTSATNLSFFLYSGFTIAGSGFIIGSRFSRGAGQKDGR